MSAEHVAATTFFVFLVSGDQEHYLLLQNYLNSRLVNSIAQDTRG